MQPKYFIHRTPGRHRPYYEIHTRDGRLKYEAFDLPDGRLLLRLPPLSEGYFTFSRVFPTFLQLLAWLDGEAVVIE